MIGSHNKYNLKQKSYVLCFEILSFSDVYIYIHFCKSKFNDMNDTQKQLRIFK